MGVYIATHNNEMELVDHRSKLRLRRFLGFELAGDSCMAGAETVMLRVLLSFGKSIQFLGSVKLD